MFPLATRKLIRGAAAHVKAGLGIAADYEADYITDYVPFDGILKNYWGTEGGNWCRLTRANGDVIEMAHHSKYLLKDGEVREGQEMAVTGNTGAITTKPHLHIQIFKNGKRVDPQNYDWEQKPSLKTTFMKVTIIANKIAWDYKAQSQTVVQWFKEYSGGRLEVVFDYVDVSFDDVPLAPFKGKTSVDIDWYRKHITPLGTGELTVFLINPDQYQNEYSVSGFMTYGDTGSPVRSEVGCPNTMDFPEAPMPVHIIFHEICHALFFISGQPDVSPVNPNDLMVHYMLYQDPPKRKELLDLIEYQKLQQSLINIKPTLMNQAKVVKSKTSPKVYVVYEMPSMEYLKTKADIEGFAVPAQLPNTDSL